MVRIGLALLFLLGGISPAVAVPNALNYQGQLFLNGNPTMGPVSITFRMFGIPTGGTVLWAETDAVTVSGGLFNTVLGDGTVLPADLFTAQVPWLEMEVNGTVLSPRVQFHSVPYALNAPPAAGNEIWETDGTNAWRLGGKIGLGTGTPVHELELRGSTQTIQLTGSSTFENLTINQETPTYSSIKADFQTVNGSGNTGTRAAVEFERPAATNEGTVHISTGPSLTRRLSVTEQGVGFGTSAPLYPIEAHTSSPGQVGYFHSTSTSGTNYGVDAGAQGVGAETNVGGYFYASGAVSNHAIIVPDGYGNVGIGTTSPHSAHRFEARTSYPGTAAFLSADATYGDNIGVDAEALGSGAATNIGGWFAAHGAANNYAIVVPAGYGNVGIGTVTPTSKLHVVGDVQITGALNVSSTKCRQVETEKFGNLYYNAVESSHAIFTTNGRAKLQNGRARIQLDPRWVAGVTIDARHPLDITSIVFYGQHGSWFARPGTDAFEIIESTGANVEFFWTVQASQKGYERLYLNRPEPMADR